MRALRSHQPGGPETLRLDTLDDPVAGPGQILVRVRASAINFPDVLIIEDKYQMRPPRPFAPGSEIAGEVEAVGDGVEGWAVGDRLIAANFYGGLSEKFVIDARQAIRLPDERSFDEGSALLLTYGTAIHALQDRGRLAAGETLLVLGAAGGVGLAAVELGKAMGARVVAAVSSEEKAAAARDAGADHAFVYPAGPFDDAGRKALAQLFKAEVGGEGADVILDPVGGDYSEAALRAIAWDGRFLVVGFPAGIAKLPLNLPLLKNCAVVGVIWGLWIAREPAAYAAEVRQLFDWWGEGKIRPRIGGTFPLERGGEAIAALRDRKAVGKLVVTL
jgi:NADPH2:quinone reductase